MFLPLAGFFPCGDRGPGPRALRCGCGFAARSSSSSVVFLTVPTPLLRSSDGDKKRPEAVGDRFRPGSKSGTAQDAAGAGASAGTVPWISSIRALSWRKSRTLLQRICSRTSPTAFRLVAADESQRTEAAAFCETHALDYGWVPAERRIGDFERHNESFY